MQSKQYSHIFRKQRWLWFRSEYILYEGSHILYIWLPSNPDKLNTLGMWYVCIRMFLSWWKRYVRKYTYRRLPFTGNKCCRDQWVNHSSVYLSDRINMLLLKNASRTCWWIFVLKVIHLHLPQQDNKKRGKAMYRKPNNK